MPIGITAPCSKKDIAMFLDTFVSVLAKALKASHVLIAPLLVVGTEHCLGRDALAKTSSEQATIEYPLYRTPP